MAYYLDILERLKANEISIVRWYTIDNIFYFACSPSIEQKEIERVQSKFIECDYMRAYNLFAVDMNKQPSGNKPIDPAKYIGKRYVEKFTLNL